MLGVARFALYATAATPLILFPQFFFPFVTTRNIFFRLCVEAAVAVVLLSGVRRIRDIETKHDVVLRWFAIYTVILAVAAVTGLAPWHSLFGDFERMGGVFAWLHLFLFYCLLRAVIDEPGWMRLFRFFVIAADVVVLWGSLEFLPDPIRNPLFRMTLGTGSTVGNQGLLGAYLLLAAALAMWDLARRKARISRIVSGGSLVILLFGIAGSQNRSSELGVLMGSISACCVLLYYSTDRARIARKLAVEAVAIITIFSVSALVVGILAPDVAERFGGRWRGFLTSPVDHARVIEWKIAAEGFKDRPLFGYGPENHQIVSSHHFDPRIYVVLGDGVFDRTHNAWLEVLATSGLFGALAMAGLWLSAIMTIRRGVRDASLSAGEAAIVSGALVAYATYLTFWFYDINSVILWVVLLAYLSSRVNGPLLVFSGERTHHVRPFAWATVGVTLLAAYFHGVIPLRAARNLSTAAGAGRFDDRLFAFERVFNSSAPQTMHTFPMYYRFLRNAAPRLSGPEATPLLRKEFDLAMQRGLIEAVRSIARNKADDRAHVDAARFFSMAGLYYSDVGYVRRARDELAKAVRISPRRADARVLLSGVRLTLRDTVGGAAELDSAMTLAPEFLPTFVYASRLELARHNVDSSASLLARVVSSRDVPVESLLGKVVDSLRARGEDARAAELAHRYMERVFGSGLIQTRPPGVAGASPFALEIASVLPLLYLNAGDATRAVLAARQLALLQPASANAAARFAADVASGQASKWRSRRVLFPEDTVGGSSTAAR